MQSVCLSVLQWRCSNSHWVLITKFAAFINTMFSVLLSFWVNRQPIKFDFHLELVGNSNGYGIEIAVESHVNLIPRRPTVETVPIQIKLHSKYFFFYRSRTTYRTKHRQNVISKKSNICYSNGE